MKKYLMFSLDDEKSKALASVLGNKTCKRIIDHLANKNEASEKDIASSLKIPINTAEYNLRKLIESGLIEKTKKFFWSKKGKKIPLYRLSNKSIVISPKTQSISSKVKSFVLVAGASGIAALLIRQLTVNNIPRGSEDALYSASQSMIELAPKTTQIAGEGNFLVSTPLWIWFLIGTLFAVIIFMLINWRKI